MSRAVSYSLAALVFGVLAVVLPDRIVPVDDNYRTVSVFGEAFRGFVLGSFRFALGAFAGLGLAAGLASIRGGGARRPVALVVSALLAVAVIGVSGFVFQVVTHFPAGGSLEERHRWAETRLDRPYREAVAWASAATALRDACGTPLRVGPATGGRNVVLVGRDEWTTTLTLDVEGEKGSARLSLEATLPFSPRDARLHVRSAEFEAGGRLVALDPAGNAQAP